MTENELGKNILFSCWKEGWFEQVRGLIRTHKKYSSLEGIKQGAIVGCFDCYRIEAAALTGRCQQAYVTLMGPTRS